ncbi:ribosome biogenesis protein SLX9 homolog [Neosynchiropus ocellatus]
MVGKIKHVRQKLHQKAVKLDVSSDTRQVSLNSCSWDKNILHPERPQAEKVSAPITFPAGLFEGTKIPSESLIQTLNVEEAPPAPPPAERGPREKKLKPKKEKMKERRERWLNKMRSITKMKADQAAALQRRAMPVVGDMRPLVDALPELSELMAPTALVPTARVRSRKNKIPVKRPQPSVNRMNQAQKRKLLETESSSFSSFAKTLSTKTNPLAEIGEILKKRMKEEEEQDLT